MKVSDIMTRDVELCLPDDGVVTAARAMERRDIGFLPVVESRDTRRPVGCLTDRDIALRAVAHDRDPDALFCREVMTRELVTCGPDDDIEQCRGQMGTHKVKRVMVCDEHGAIVGVVSMADLARSIDARAVGKAVERITTPASGDE